MFMLMLFLLIFFAHSLINFFLLFSTFVFECTLLQLLAVVVSFGIFYSVVIAFVGSVRVQKLLQSGTLHTRTQIQRHFR